MAISFTMIFSFLFFLCTTIYDYTVSFPVLLHLEFLPSYFEACFFAKHFVFVSFLLFRMIGRMHFFWTCQVYICLDSIIYN